MGTVQFSYSALWLIYLAGAYLPKQHSIITQIIKVQIFTVLETSGLTFHTFTLNLHRHWLCCPIHHCHNYWRLHRFLALQLWHIRLCQLTCKSEWHTSASL